MHHFRFARAGLLAATLALSAAPGLLTIDYAAKADAVSPAVSKIINDAQNLLKARKTKEALAKIREADAVGGKSGYEQYLVKYTMGSIAQAAGDYELAAQSFDAVINSGQVSGASRLRLIQAMGPLYMQVHNYPKAIVWMNTAIKEGGDTPGLRTTLIQTYYSMGDYNSALKESKAIVQADEKANRAPSEETLQVLANCYLKVKDEQGYGTTMEKLVAYHPKASYWADLLSRLPKRQGGFSSSLGLDLLRLKQATGVIKSADDYVDLIEQTIQAGLSAEAKRAIDAGNKAGVLGTGTGASRHKRLEELATKKAAEELQNLPKNEQDAKAAADGTALTNVGFAYVQAGQAAKGIPLIEQGIAKGGLKRPDDAKLHLGIAYYLAGQKSKAMAAFKSVAGTDGTAELAHYWVFFLSNTK